MLGEEENEGKIESNVYIALRLTTASLLRLFKSNEFVAAALACIRGNSKHSMCVWIHVFNNNNNNKNNSWI